MLVFSNGEEPHLIAALESYRVSTLHTPHPIDFAHVCSKNFLHFSISRTIFRLGASVTMPTLTIMEEVPVAEKCSTHKVYL